MFFLSLLSSFLSPALHQLWTAERMQLWPIMYSSKSTSYAKKSDSLALFPFPNGRKSRLPKLSLGWKKYPEIKNKRTSVSRLNHYLIEISASYYLNKALLNSKVFMVSIVRLNLCMCVCSHTIDRDEHAHTDENERKREEVQIEEGRRTMIRGRRKYEK